MIIKKYDKYKNNHYRLVTYNKKGFCYLYNLNMFLSSHFGYVKRKGILTFIKECSLGIRFEWINVDIDHENDLVYINESYESNDPKFDTPEINTLIEADNFIALCKMGLVDYTVMTKDNFTHLLFAWDKIIDTLPPFALLYQDDQGWYDVLSFDTQETMEQFIADHTAIEDIHE